MTNILGSISFYTVQVSVRKTVVILLLLSGQVGYGAYPTIKSFLENKAQSEFTSLELVETVKLLNASDETIDRLLESHKNQVGESRFKLQMYYAFGSAKDDQPYVRQGIRNMANGRLYRMSGVVEISLEDKRAIQILLRRTTFQVSDHGSVLTIEPLGKIGAPFRRLWLTLFSSKTDFDDSNPPDLCRHVYFTN